MGILRKAFVVGVIVAAIPLPAEEQARQGFDQGPGTFAYISAASEAYADARGFCQRQPTVCATADFISQTMMAKARYAARLAMEWTSGDAAEPKHHERKKATSTIVVKSEDPAYLVPVEAASEGEPKTIGDLMPELRGAIYDDQG